jgi:pyrroloquinoline quinone biosynthesis protein D
VSEDDFTSESRPFLLRGVRLKHDQVRKCWVLLAPERFLRLNGISVDILQRCDGAAPLARIVDELAEKYQADRARVERDVRALLAGLLDKRMLGL